MASSGAGARGFGGRNRLRSLEQTDGGGGVSPPAGKNMGMPLPATGPETHAGSHDPKSITTVAKLPAQDTMQNRSGGRNLPGGPGGIGGSASPVDLGHKIPTQRSMYPSPDNKGESSASQGPDGEFGGSPGQKPDVPSISYP